MFRVPTHPVAALLSLALLVMHVGKALAQHAADTPAAALVGSCKRLDIDRKSIASPIQVDLAVSVDEAGRPTATRTNVDIVQPAVLSAVTAMALSCTYLPALSAGKPVAGTARLAFQMMPGVTPGATTAPPPSSNPAIADVSSCAPTSKDYPAESLRLNESGTTKVTFTVDSTGRLDAFGVTKSSGSLRLDFTALIKLAGCKFAPGRSADGSPAGGTFSVDYVWRIE